MGGEKARQHAVKIEVVHSISVPQDEAAMMKGRLCFGFAASP
jgi:hypothetical protein